MTADWPTWSRAACRGVDRQARRQRLAMCLMWTWAQPTVQMLLAHLQARARGIALAVLGAAPAHLDALQAEQAYRSWWPPRHEHIALAWTARQAGGRDAVRRLLRGPSAASTRCWWWTCSPWAPPGISGAVGPAPYRGVIIATATTACAPAPAHPPLTAVNLHLDEVARLAIDLLFERLRGGGDHPAVDSPLPQLVVVRPPSRSRRRRERRVPAAVRGQNSFSSAL